MTKGKKKKKKEKKKSAQSSDQRRTNAGRHGNRRQRKDPASVVCDPARQSVSDDCNPWNNPCATRTLPSD